jgi:hypothetical protein
VSFSESPDNAEVNVCKTLLAVVFTAAVAAVAFTAVAVDANVAFKFAKVVLTLAKSAEVVVALNTGATLGATCFTVLVAATVTLWKMVEAVVSKVKVILSSLTTLAVEEEPDVRLMASKVPIRVL